MNSSIKIKPGEESPHMAESITESEKDFHEEAIKKNEPSLQESPHVAVLADKPIASVQPLIIWTPRFIVIFVLALVVGLSTASLLTQGWLNGYYQPSLPELIYASVALCCWIALIFCARSAWVRLGAIFGSIWAIFIGSTFAITLLVPIDRTWTIIAHITSARNIALLGCFICLSIAHTPFRRWDTWFFRLAPLISIAAVAYAYFHAPAQFHTFRDLENHMTNIVLYLCIAVWWLRPSCWRAQPGLTFLLGMVPLMQRLLGIPFPHNEEPILFYTEVFLLLFALAALHTIQYERGYAKEQ
jgi:hypothetical protein